MKLEVILITVTGELIIRPIGPHDQKANISYRYASVSTLIATGWY
jgi:hypothetical protein